jgi:hypothetical protein
VKRVSRALAAVVAAGLAVPLWTAPASAQAQAATETASSVGYFFSGGAFQPEGAPQAPPNLLSDRGLDFVAANNLGVAAVGGQEDKVSFAFFSLSTLPFDAVITKATMTVKLAPDSNDNRRINPSPDNVRACAPGDTGFGGEDGQSLSQKAPARKCDVFTANALPSSTPEQYVFDVSALAANWMSVNDGVALTKREDSAANFQVVFTPDVQLDVEFTAPPPEAEAAPADDVSVDLGGVTSSPSFDSGTPSFGGGGGGGSTSLGGGFGGAVAAPLTGAQLGGAPAPETAVDAPAVAAQTRAAPAAASESLTPTAGFWLAGLLLAGGLAFLSLVMGDPRTAAPAGSARPSRLSQALSSGGGSALVTRT